MGDYTYRRLANALAGRFDVAAISLPGYTDGEALPRSIEAFGAVMAQAVHECAAGRPFTLAGFSTGGLASHATAAHLEKTGSEALLHRSTNERIPVFYAVLCGCCHATDGFRACARQHAIKDGAADGDFRLLRGE